MEDPRRARTGQVLEDRIAVKRSELRKGKKKAKDKAKANKAAPAAETQEQDVAEGGGEATASSGPDKMDEDEAASANGDGGAGSKEGEGVEEESDDDGSGGDEEREEGLEEDNLRELSAGSRGKVRLGVMGQNEEFPHAFIFCGVMDIIVWQSGSVFLCLRTSPLPRHCSVDRIYVWGHLLLL